MKPAVVSRVAEDVAAWQVSDDLSYRKVGAEVSTESAEALANAQPFDDNVLQSDLQAA